MRRRTKVLLAVIGLLVAAVIVVAILLSTGVLTGSLRRRIASGLTTATCRPTSVGRVQVSLSGRVVLHDVVLHYDDGSPLATIPEAVVRLAGGGGGQGLTSLAQVREVTVTNPTVRLIRSREGKWPTFGAVSTAGRPVQLPSRIQITNGTFTIADEQRKTTSTVRAVNLTATSPQAGKLDFTMQAAGGKDEFAQLTARGSYVVASRRAEITLRASDVSLTYAWSLLPPVRGISVAGGRADVDGTITIASPAAGQRAVITPNLNIRPRAATVSFPWLRQPIQEVTGTIRIADSNVTIASATGRVAGAPISAHGTVAHLPRAALNLQFTATSIGMEQVRALFPTVKLPDGMTVRGPMQVVAQATGSSPNFIIRGRARIGEVVLACIPWHDMVADFVYQRGALVTDVRAHGSPRELEAGVQVRISPGPAAAQATVTMRNVSLTLLEGCFPSLRAADISGTADLTVQVAAEKATTLQGSFTARDVTYRGIAIGAVTGDFTSRGTTVQVARGTLAGPSARGTFSGTVGRTGEFSVAADLTSLDLSALKLPIPVTPSSAHVRLAGSAPQSRVSGRVEVAFAAADRLPASTLSADVAVTSRELAFTNVTVQAAHGQATGQMVVTNWHSRIASRLNGRFQLTDVPIEEWLPPGYAAALPPSLATGTVEVGGRIADPRFVLDLRLTAAATAPEPGTEVGRIQATYEHGGLQIQQAEITTAQGHVSVSGTISPTTGINITATGVTIDLGAVSGAARGTTGLALSGTLLVDLHATGPLMNPEVTFQAASGDGITVNDVPFRELLVAGKVSDGVLTLETASVRQEDGSIAATGTVNLLTRQVDLVVTLRDLSVFNAMFIADQAVWRRYYLTGTRPVSSSYAAVPRPLGGSLSASVHVTGPVLGPELQVADLLVNRFSFRGREIAQVRGSLTIAFAGGGIRSIDIPLPGIEATEQNAVARLWGDAVFGGAINLHADISTLDLSLLEPWLPGVTGLGGQASVNADITGPSSNPRVRGDVFVDNFSWRSFHIARAEFSPIVWEGNQIVIEGITLRSGAMEATGTARLVVETALGQGPQFVTLSPSGWLRVTNGSFALVEGMKPATYNAYVELTGTALNVEQLSAEGPLKATPGVTGTLGGGPFTVIGTVEFPTVTLPAAFSQLSAAKYDLTIDLGTATTPVGIDIDDFMSVKLAGRLRMGNGTITVDDRRLVGPILRTETGRPLIISDGWVGVPPAGKKVTAQALPLAAPPLADVLFLAGPDLRFQYGPVRAPVVVGGPPVKPTTGYLYARGPLTAQDLTLDGRFEARKGTIRFPAGTLEIESARADIAKAMGQLPQITISARATGTVGDYLVSLNPTGRVYPPPGPNEPPLSLGIHTIPTLSEPLALALLIGSVVVPETGTVGGPLEMLTHPWETLPTAGRLTGITIPGLGAPGVAVNWLFQGPAQLVLRQRLFGRLFASYASPLGGPTANEQLTFTYQVARRYYVGWSINALDQTRWQVQSFTEF